MTDTTGLILKNGLVQTMDMPTELPDLSLGNITITNTSGQSVVGATARIENGDLYFTSTGEQLQGTGFVYTYSVDISNLQNTITPPGIGPANFDGFAYQYKYDDRNRLTEKKIPGKDWEYIVYDNLDRPVMTQDANQRAKSPKEWSFTKYDALGRPAYTGLYRSDLPISIIRNIFKNNTAPQNYETKVALGSGYDGTYYTNDNFPTSSIEVLTVNYYDDYTFDMATLSLPASYEGQDIINYNNASGTKKGTKGLATGSKVKVLETTDWITNVTGYDKKGRPIYVASNNAYLGTIDIARSRLDFTGNVEKTETAHTKDGTTISTEDLFTYDHMNRLITQKQNINGQGQELIAKNRYDELGQLIGKEVGNTEASPLQDVDYSYTVRGWLKTINNPYSLSENNDLFAFGISYNETDLKSQYANYDTPLYNGNISQLRWRSENTDRSIRHYTLIYDALNRMESSYSATNYAIDLKFREHIYGYDKNGNIESLYRTMQDDSATNGYSYIDNLEYDYTGNQLLSVTDSYGLSGMGAEGFMDSNIVGDDYRYDANGNMLVDLNKGIGTVMADGITYNHLNLPTYIEINDGNDNVGNITYIYDALGNKQTKGVMHIGTYNSLTTTYYAGNYVYQGNFMSGGCSGCPPPPPPTPIWLKFINQPEGYIEPKNELDLSQGFDYVYRYRDHLGNIRLSYKDSNEDGSITGGSTQIFFDDFETASGWDGTGASWGHPISSFDSNFKLQGNYAGRIDRTGSSSVAVHSLTWVPINNSSDTEYIYSGWAYSNGPTIRLGLAMKEAGETGYLTLFDDIYVGTKNTWVYVEKRVIVPANMVLINLRIEANSSNVNGTVWWDNVSIRKVNDLLAVEILEENNYYPFGLKHKGYNTNVTSTNLALKYKFGGKEYQDELGLDWYDVSARNYDPALGRWMNLDPLAEKMRRHSPYNYAFDNPIYFIDYDGMMPTGPGDPPKKKLQNAIIAIGEAVTDGLETIGSWFTSDNSSPSNRTSERLDVEGEGIRIWGNNKTNEGSTADNGDSKGSLETKDIPSAPGGHKGTGKTPVTALKGGLKDTQKVESFFERGNDIVDSNKSENSVEKWDGSFATSTSKSNERGDNPIIVTKYFSISGTDTNFTTQTESYRTLDAKADSTLTVNNSWPTPRREDSSIVVDSVTIQY
ncbi:RHS repeat-associated core domain-containing protein [Flavivirga sp. 57AJ16]|uniref:RHS repeat-associated core domain-containing protein n=1 Tax=Flavivirga sp. 57AJ16 TaxID=3025307 RepID=UPI00236647EF|nr:RHS repeat-associated core domain-containing protein [Flavivirga sp. 57AJ16]MDD7888276.1 hypothetical protein [Flavivirga sp. 57AJ16]